MRSTNRIEVHNCSNENCNEYMKIEFKYQHLVDDISNNVYSKLKQDIEKLVKTVNKSNDAEIALWIVKLKGFPISIWMLLISLYIIIMLLFNIK